VEATYSTEKWVDEHEAYKRRLARERAQLKAPNLSFRNGPPPITPRTGELGIHDTALGVWDEVVDDGMEGVLRHALAILHVHRFEVMRDPECEEQYPTLADHHWRARRGELRLRVRLSGRHVEIMGYQELNVSHQSGGEYDSGKYAKMPRAMQLGLTALFTTLIRALRSHGYGFGDERDRGRPLGLVVRDAMLGYRRAERRSPFEAFNDQWRLDRFERDKTGFMAVKEYALACWGSGKDGDGSFLCTGDTRYFYHYSSHRLMRGTFYPAPNGQCMVAAGGEYLWMQMSKLFDCDPTKTRRRYVPGQRERLHREIEKALKAQSYARVATLGAVLARTA